MRWTAVVITVLAVLVGVVLALSQGPDIRTESVTVAVPTGPGEATSINLDAQLYLPETTPAPAVLLAHGFGSDRTTLDDTARSYAADGYLVMTWSARGFGASGGVIGLNDPDAEVADVSQLIDLLAERAEVARDSADDPRVAVVGGSYGGGVALLAAAEDPRIDAVVAAAAWHRLSDALAPNRLEGPGVWKARWASVLFTAGALGPTAFDPASAAPDAPDPAFCGRFDPTLCDAYGRTAVTGLLDPQDAALLDRASPSSTLDRITAPTLLIAGQEDTLFGLEESLRNATRITAPLALRWVAGGHGEASRVDGDDARRWLDLHLREAPADLPTFSWMDVVAGSPQPLDELPGVGDGAVTLALAADGRLTADGESVAGGEPFRQDDDAATVAGDGRHPSDAVTITRPPGGLPAALSTLPGLGALGSLLPSVDIPGQSAVFTSDPLDDDATLLGVPRLTLDVDADVEEAVLFIKIHDVSPGGQARLLQSAVNATRVADVPTQITVDLEPLAHRIIAGHRLRLTVATTDQAFAAGVEPAVVSIGTDGGALVVPTVEGSLASPLPAAVRIALPVLLVLALALLAAAATRRHERRLAEAPSYPSRPRPDTEPARIGPARPTGPASPDPIVIRGLVKRYADGKVAVDGLDLTVGRGQVFGLLGPNGAGKTTTMRMLLGLIRPTDGSIELLGHQMRPGHPVLGRVGVLVEGPGFAPYLTGMQNLRSFWAAGRRPWAEAAAERALTVADLGAAIHRPTRTYSHGMRQRLAIAQALLGSPELLVLDEPTDGLDPEQIRAMRQLLARLGEEGLTILVSSHLLAEVEQMCTHAAVVRTGRVVAAGPVADLLGTTLTMVIQTDDRDRARTVLETVLPAEDIDVEGSGLAVRLGTASPDALIATLVQAGVGVTAATPRGRLEDVFLELTGAQT